MNTIGAQKLRVAWLAPFPAQALPAGIRTARVSSVFHPSSWIVSLSAALAAREEIELHLFTESHLVCATQSLRAGPITYHVLRSGIPFTHRRFPAWFPVDVLTGQARLARRLAAAVCAARPDIVHAHGVEAVFARAAGLTRLPYLISIQGILTEYYKSNPCLRYRIGRHWEQAAVRHGRYFTCRTAFDTGFVQQFNAPARIFHIHEAMRPEFFAADWEVAATADVLFVGSLEQRKGVEDLLRALAAVKQAIPHVRLRLVGAGSPAYVERLHALCHQLDLAGHVEFLGFQPAAEVARWHRASQVFVLPSHMENSPNTLAEAMVSGLPVIATAVGGVPSLIEPGHTGLLVPAHEPAALAAALSGLLQQPERRQLLGHAARTVARTRHLPAAVAEQTLTAYRTILAEQKG